MEIMYGPKELKASLKREVETMSRGQTHLGDNGCEFLGKLG